MARVLAAPEGERYSIGELARMSGVSVRALRHYEDVGLLAPARAENGYRAYGPREVRRLSQILAMRACDLPLSTIGKLLRGDDRDVAAVLAEHLRSLREQNRELELAIGRTERAIATVERMDAMSAKERFEALKAQAVRENEERYGEEARALYGDSAVDASNRRILSLTQEEWDDREALGAAINERLKAAMETGDPAGPAAMELARMHQRWIQLHWGFYSEEAHLGLARGYLADDRFRSYYDGAAGAGATDFLVSALEAYLLA